MRSLMNQTIGEYRVVAFLGAGGMGEVYRAVHTRLGRVIAIKVLTQPVEGGNQLQRFYNEAAVQASLRHPAVAEYYGMHEVDGRPCILMEYVDGETVHDRMRVRGPFPASEAVRVLLAVTDAVAHLHDQGVVHRDLKSGNVKITSAGQVKLLDFGIARGPRTARMTQTGAVIGTLENLSPEQISGGEADARSDVWALGVLLYEMITGRLPFESGRCGGAVPDDSQCSVPAAVAQGVCGEPRGGTDPGAVPGEEPGTAVCVGAGSEGGAAGGRGRSRDELATGARRVGGRGGGGGGAGVDSGVASQVPRPGRLLRAARWRWRRAR